jgi:CheY-like chemotaxis protein
MHKRKILIADDDSAIREGITMILEDAGYDVSSTTNGETIGMVQHYAPDLILLDIWMSGMDGRDICRELKKHTQTKQIPIIMISANRDTEQIALACGANGFLAKPFEMDNLLAIVQKFITPLSTC